MSMEITNNYNNYINAYANQVKKQQEVKKQDDTVKQTEKGGAEKYLSELQKKHKELNIMSGSVDTAKRSGTGKTDVKIAPNILAEMASNPQAEAKYGKMLSAIPRLDKWADSMIKAMTGSDVQYRQVWIDEKGDMGSFVITEPSKEQKKADETRHKKEQEENTNRIEKRKEEKIRFEKWLEKQNGEFEIYPMNRAEIGKLMKFDKRM